MTGDIDHHDRLAIGAGTGMMSRMTGVSVRVDVVTHEALERLAAEMGTTVCETIAIAVRHLRQDRIGRDLRTLPSAEESDWLNADLG